jgi:pyruvate dehydrogenase E2 component (dihydrolipoamide acetyltransferase)
LKRGDVVAVVETQKGAIEIEIFNAGVMSELVVPVGQRVPVGTLLARVDGAMTAVAAAPAHPVVVPAPVTPTVPATPLPPVAPGRQPVSPAARRLAAERGVDLQQLAGTGPGGAITVADVEAAKQTPAPAEATRRRTGFDPAAMRQAIAAAMSRSKREIPHYYLTQTTEVSAALKRLETMNAERPPPRRLLPAAMFLRAIALAMAKTPELNGFWEDGRFRPGDGPHIGWAVALRGGGLVAPAIRDAGQRSLDELMAAMRDLVQRARVGPAWLRVE